MIKQLNISPTLALPIEAVTQTFAILAKKGSGKTYIGSVMAEEMLNSGQCIVAVDPTGAWWGLRFNLHPRSTRTTPPSAWLRNLEQANNER